MTSPRSHNSDTPSFDLGREFRAHLVEVKELLADPRLAAAQNPTLQQAAVEIRSLAKRISRELGTSDFFKDRVDSASLRRTAEFLQRSEQLVESVQQQLHWRTQVTRQAEELRPFAEIILRHHANPSELVSYETLVQFVTPWLNRNPLSTWPADSHPFAQLSIDFLAERWSDPLAARVHVLGVLSAWSAIHYAKRLWLNDRDILPLVIAALLQDIGILALDRARQDSSAWHEEQDSLPRDHHRHHPTIGAAIVAEITDMPPLVTNLITSHHTNPNILPAQNSALSRHARLLQIIVRQEELRLEQNSIEYLTLASDASTLLSRLLSEAAAGNLDPELVRLFVSSTAFEEIPARTVTPSLPDETNRHYILDPPHLGTDRAKGSSGGPANLERINEQTDV